MCFIKHNRIKEGRASSRVTLLRLQSASCGDITGGGRKFASRKWTRHLAISVWQPLCRDMSLLLVIRALRLGELDGNYRTTLLVLIPVSRWWCLHDRFFRSSQYCRKSVLGSTLSYKRCTHLHSCCYVGLVQCSLLSTLSIQIKTRTLRECRSIAHDNCLLPR